MLTALKTDTGKIRQHNEDDAGIFKGKDEFILAVVADGMGGHLAGDVASKMAVKAMGRNGMKQRLFQLRPRNVKNGSLNRFFR